MVGRHFHQAARHVYRVAGRRDVVVAAPAQSGGNDHPEMRADLESEA